MLPFKFFQRDALDLAKALLGKVLRVKYKNLWLSAQIIETEAYYLTDKASHASLGFTKKRSALFMPAGTIYMYYARGGDSLNFSAIGEGNAVLIKSATVFIDAISPETNIQIMQQLNPIKPRQALRSPEKLCAGQTLVCKSLNLKVADWDQKQLCRNKFYLEDVKYRPEKFIQTKRLGIPIGRDEHLLYRFIDFAQAKYCSKNPLTQKNWRQGQDFLLLDQ